GRGRALRQAASDHPAVPGGERGQRHDDPGEKFVLPGRAPAQRDAGDLPRRRTWLALPVPRLVRAAGNAVPGLGREEIHMSASTTAMSSSTSGYNAPAFWERLWRSSGIQFVVLFILAYIIYGYQPQVGAPADALIAFYDGHRTRILIAVFFFGLNLLNLLWFAAALRATLADAG